MTQLEEKLVKQFPSHPLPEIQEGLRAVQHGAMFLPDIVAALTAYFVRVTYRAQRPCLPAQPQAPQKAPDYAGRVKSILARQATPTEFSARLHESCKDYYEDMNRA